MKTISNDYIVSCNLYSILYIISLNLFTSYLKCISIYKLVPNDQMVLNNISVTLDIWAVLRNRLKDSEFFYQPTVYLNMRQNRNVDEKINNIFALQQGASFIIMILISCNR